MNDRVQCPQISHVRICNKDVSKIILDLTGMTDSIHLFVHFYNKL